MTRQVLLLTIGADPLPATTPVIPVPATWVPAIYVPPAVPAPADVLASAIADAVLLTWAAVDALAPEYEIERAPDADGVPGTWALLSKTQDLRYIAAAPDGLAYWFRLRTESLGRFSAYTDPVVGVPIASNPVSVPLAIVAGVVTINCAYTDFRLVLNANVTSVIFVNVPSSTTLSIDIEQMGAFTIVWPASVSPVSTVPYVVSQTVGAVDVVGLKTQDTGVTWRMLYTKPAASGGTSFAITLAPSPASATVVTDGVTATAPSVQVTATPVGGTAPITHAWTRADTFGGTSFMIDNAAIAAPTFSIPAGVLAYNATQQWRDTATDAATLVATALVDVTLSRTSTAAFSLTISPSPAEAYGFTTAGTPIVVSVGLTAMPGGETGTVSYSWAKLSGGAANINSATSRTPTISLASGWTNITSVSMWRCTATDSGSGLVTTSDVQVTLERANDL